MFGRIAHRYDLLNRLMTFGMDIRWRSEAISHLNFENQEWVLDTGAGTGDLSLAIKQRHPGARVIASDFTPEMILEGRNRPGAANVLWVICDAQSLPFKNEQFGSVISGYLLRNVPDIRRTIREQHRILKQGRSMVSLDTTPPRESILKPLILFYLRKIIPILGKLVAGDSEAYTYLPSSTEGFLSAEKVVGIMEETGFSEVKFSLKMFGTMAIHWGVKTYR